VPNYEDEFTTQPLFNNSLDEDDSVEFEDDSVECGEQEVSWQDLECWGDVLARENVYRRFPHLSTQAAGLAVQEPEHSVFPHDDKINDKVALWVGGIAQLRVDAVVLASAASILDPSETGTTLPDLQPHTPQISYADLTSQNRGGRLCPPTLGSKRAMQFAFK